MYKNNDLNVEILRAKIRPVKYTFDIFYPHEGTETYIHVTFDHETNKNDLKDFAALEAEANFVIEYNDYMKMCTEKVKFVDDKIKRWLDNPNRDLGKHVIELWIGAE